MFAVLMASLAPVLSHAFSADPPVGWAEICSSAGVQRVPLGGDDNGAPKAPSGAHLLEHCPYCSLHVDSFGLPPGTSPVVQHPLGLLALLPPAWWHAPRTPAVWVRAQPRAPPVLG